ncbi:MAG: hypothetical protein Q9226_003316 [Calogaya cf. arnoldii]
MASEEAPFLPPVEKPAGDDEIHQPRVLRQNCRCTSWTKTLWTHFGIMLVYTIVSILVVSSQRCTIMLPPAAIDNLHMRFKPTLFHRLNATPYAGPPSPAVDDAWDALLAPMHISVSQAELDRDNQDSVALPESGGYLGWMGVFHELHCIRMLREWNYRSYYHRNLSSEEQEHLGQHADHCFEMLRQSAVCHADASLTTFEWSPERSRPMFNASESLHMCVDWELLMESIENRVVHEAEILRLQNPLSQTD